MYRSDFLVRQLCKKLLAKEKDLFLDFMNLIMAYNRVDKDALWQVMYSYVVDRKLLKAVQSFYVAINLNQISGE